GLPRAPGSPVFPYAPLFRSARGLVCVHDEGAVAAQLEHGAVVPGRERDLAARGGRVRDGRHAGRSLPVAWSRAAMTFALIADISSVLIGGSTLRSLA